MRVSIDLTCKDEVEATQMMIYHLKLACAYFECTDEDRGLNANKEIRLAMEGGWANAASAFVDVMCSAYEDSKSL